MQKRRVNMCRYCAMLMMGGCNYAMGATKRCHATDEMHALDCRHPDAAGLGNLKEGIVIACPFCSFNPSIDGSIRMV